MTTQQPSWEKIYTQHYLDLDNDPQQYMHYLKDRALCFYLSNLATISISGIDADSFLQGQLSCDLDTINKETSGIGTHNNIKGRMISSFRIIQINPANEPAHYLLVVDKSIVDTTIEQLKKYAVFSKLHIERGQHYILASSESDTVPQENSHHTQTIHHVMYRKQSPCIQIDNTGQRFIYILNEHSVVSFWQQLIQQYSPAHLRIWQAYDIQQGLAWITATTQDKFLPQTFNYHSEQIKAVSFNKGCYIGQEIIIRTQHRGKLKRGLFKLKTEHKQVNQCLGVTLRVNDKIIAEIIARASYTQQQDLLLVVMQMDTTLEQIATPEDENKNLFTTLEMQSLNTS